MNYPFRSRRKGQRVVASSPRRRNSITGKKLIAQWHDSYAPGGYSYIHGDSVPELLKAIKARLEKDPNSVRRFTISRPFGGSKDIGVGEVDSSAGLLTWTNFNARGDKVIKFKSPGRWGIYLYDDANNTRDAKPVKVFDTYQKADQWMMAYEGDLRLLGSPRKVENRANPIGIMGARKRLKKLNPSGGRRAITKADERYFLRQRTAVGPFFVRPSRSREFGDNYKGLDAAILWAHRESWSRPGDIIKVFDSQGTTMAMVRDGKEIEAAEWIDRNPNPARPSDIVYESGDYYVIRTPKGGFEVYRQGPTAATRVSQIGYQGQKGLDRAKEEIERRQSDSRRRNPNGGASDADKLYQDFHGRPSTKTTEVHTKLKSRERLSELGDLVELRVITPTGKKATLVQDDTGMWQPSHQKQPSYIDVNRNTPMLSSSPDRRQLYIEGGVQEVELGLLGLGGDWKRDNMLLGILTHVTYRTEKGFDKFQLTDYYHKLGEETGDEPVLTYDTLNGLLTVVGGRYEVRPEGIVN